MGGPGRRPFLLTLARQALAERWDPSQPRDVKGRWSSGGGSGASPEVEGTYADILMDRPSWATPEMDAAVAVLAADGGAFRPMLGRDAYQVANDPEMVDWAAPTSDYDAVAPGPRALAHTEAQKVIGKAALAEVERKHGEAFTAIEAEMAPIKARRAEIAQWMDSQKEQRAAAMYADADAEAQRRGFADRFEWGQAEGLELAGHIRSYKDRHPDTERERMLDEDHELWRQQKALSDEAASLRSSATLATLAELRPMHSGPHGGNVEFGPADDALWLSKRMEESLAVFPRSWVRASEENGPLRVEGQHGLDARSHYRETKGIGYTTRVVSVDTEYGGSRAMTHELVHCMESANPAIKAAEWSYYWGRTGGVPGQPTPPTESLATSGVGYAASEQTRPDEFVDPYMGKTYGHGHHTEHYELLSVSVPMLLDDSSPTSFAAQDPDMAAWTLGVLATA